jgi:anti-sigma factor RsiW
MHLTDHVTDAQLNEYLDNETTERVQIELHLDSCDECAARLSTLQNLFAEIESLPEVALTRDLAAPFTLRPSLPAHVPAWLPLTVTLQAAFALVALIIAAPFVSQLLPALETPSLGNVFIQLQTQWATWLDMLAQFQLPTFPTISFELSSLYLISALAVVSVIWLVGNGLLLRNQIK